MTEHDESFEDFLRRREVVSGDFINGDDSTLAALSATRDPATFFPPNGAVVQGAQTVIDANHDGARSFRTGSHGHFEILQSASAGDLGFWTGRQHATAMLVGRDDPVPMTLRVTEVFRREDGAWKLVHRHADPVRSPD